MIQFTMPQFLAGVGVAIATAFRFLLVSMIGRVFLTMGVGLYTAKYALPAFTSFIQSKFDALPPFILQSVSYAGLDIVVTAVLSAAAVRALGDVFFARRPTA